MVRLVPRDTKFFDMFAEMATNITDGARLLKAILDDFDNVEVRVQQLKDLEHRGDEMTHAILVKLNSTFITPFDREDIHALASAMDDVLDFVYAAGERLVMYKIPVAPAAASELASVIIRQSEQLAKAVSMCTWRRVALMISSTRMPWTINASAISERWQRHGTASAHIRTTRSRAACSMRLARFFANSGVCM